jgi:hypothetical protein
MYNYFVSPWFIFTSILLFFSVILSIVILTDDVPGNYYMQRFEACQADPKCVYDIHDLPASKIREFARSKG